MTILAIETSCDETSAAVLNSNSKGHIELLSNIIATSLPMHGKTGGIIPENAAREQLKYIIPSIENALRGACLTIGGIDKLAVTIGPGLIGSLLVGVETVKTFAYVLDIPVIEVNHLFGHIYANFLDKNAKDIEFPAIALIVSGGHTDLVLINSHNKFKWLGGTRDDAAGEAMDKIGRLLGLPYPGGPYIEKEALGVLEDKFNFPRPLINSNDFDFSFSGLKTAVFRKVSEAKNLDKDTIKNISYSLQTAVFETLIKKTLKAARKYDAKSILLGGGVAVNQKLRKEFAIGIVNSELDIALFVPEKSLCTDNAAMIGAAAFFSGIETPWQKVDANSELYFD